ncbi:hypothetical protein BG011_006786 [Mortierella polycephala]|uniref:Arrestin-like N-terminal domain-containing protein n=1 Tax=Mortierella polycephala TaxID=41804 RepID=A0A9P6QHN4_9FUNG|nr:hypothetical protein BG011_006786 [Mortierella polycephala]
MASLTATNCECKGEWILYSFVGKASSSFEDDDDTIHGKLILFEQHRGLDAKRPSRAGKLSPGQYEASFEVTLPPTLPPSSRDKHGRVSYILEVRLVREWSLKVIVTKEVWFLPTKLSMPPVGPQLTVATSSGYWKNALPYSTILPSDVLCLGQLVPVTIRLEGDEALSAETSVEAISHLDEHDTVMFQLSMMLNLTPTTDTPVYSVRHSVNLVLGIIVKGLGGLMKAKVRVQIARSQQVARHAAHAQVQGKVEGDIDEIKW